MPLETFSNLEPLDQVRTKINATITAVNDLQSVGSASWGNISGILADQLDLQNALDLKVNTSTLSNYETTTQLNTRDTANRSRDNHTGTQLAETISNFDSSVSSLVQPLLDEKQNLEINQGVLPFASTVNLDMSVLTGTQQTISLTGNLTFTSSNRANGRQVVLRLICDSSSRSLNFPTEWIFIGIKPTQISSNKVGVLSLTFFGSNDTDAIASYGEQA